MKKLFLFLSLICILSCSSTPPPKTETPPVKKDPTLQVSEESPVNWRTDFAAALAEAKRENKLIILYFSADGCGPCKMMRGTTLKEPRIVKMLNESYVPVQLRGYKYIAILETFEMETVWPSVAFLYHDGTFVGGLSGYIKPEVFEALLEKVLKVKAEAEAEVEAGQEAPQTPTQSL